MKRITRFFYKIALRLLSSVSDIIIGILMIILMAFLIYIVDGFIDDGMIIYVAPCIIIFIFVLGYFLGKKVDQYLLKKSSKKNLDNE